MRALEVGDSADNKSNLIQFERISIRFTGCDIVVRRQVMVMGVFVTVKKLSKIFSSENVQKCEI